MPYFRDADPAYDPESQEIDYYGYCDYSDDGNYFDPDEENSRKWWDYFRELDRRDDLLRCAAAYKIQAFWKRRCETK